MPHDDKELFLLLGRLEGKVDATLAKLDEYTSKHEKLEARISTLEAVNQKQVGAVTSLLTMGKAVWALVGAAGVYIYKLYLENPK